MQSKFDSNDVPVNGQASLKDRVRELQLSNRLDGGKVAKAGSSASWLPWMLCIFMALAWAGVGIRYYKTAPATAPAATGEANGTKQKNSASEESGPAVAAGEIVLESKGYLIPSHSISVSPIDVAGRVIELSIEEGKSFNKGDVLAVIDSTRFDADAKEAEAQVAAAKARYLESKESWDFEKQQADAELGEARSQSATNEIEYKTAKATRSEAVSKLDLTTLEMKWKSAEQHVNVVSYKRDLTYGTPRAQRIEATRRDWIAAEARFNRAKWSLDNCTIRAR